MNKHSILGFNDVKVHPVEVPEWDSTLYVKSMSGADRASLLAKFKSEHDDLSVDVVIKCACNEEGKVLFDATDREALLSKSASALDKIALAALELNGLAQKSIDSKKST